MADEEEIVGPVEVEAWVIVDSSGNYAVGTSLDDACEAFEDSIGGSQPRRAVKLKLTVPLPGVPVLVGVVPADSAAGAQLKVE